MLRRFTFSLLIVGMTALLTGPALAARPSVAVATITSVDMIQTSFPCPDRGVELSATFLDVGDGRYSALFGIHDAIYGSTLTKWRALQICQTSATFQLGSATPTGDTFDRGEVTLLHRGRVVDQRVVVTTISCP